MDSPDRSNRVNFDTSDARSVRRAVRSGLYRGFTAGFARDRVQANICILPRRDAEDFLLYCQRNPKPCPLIARSDIGDPALPQLGDDLDIRSDVPRYHVFRDGVFSEEVDDIAHLWREDFVTFALGCSFSFEYALLETGLPLRYLDRGDVAGVYETNIATVAAGSFRANLLVTMRPFRAADAIRAVQITSRFPDVHGAPIHLGDPSLIGVDLSRRYKNVGSAELLSDEIPLFWACGLTPQLAAANAKPSLCITHAPSSMLVTDLRNASLASF